MNGYFSFRWTGQEVVVKGHDALTVDDKTEKTDNVIVIGDCFFENEDLQESPHLSLLSSAQRTRLPQRPPGRHRGASAGQTSAGCCADAAGEGERPGDPAGSHSFRPRRPGDDPGDRREGG